MKLYLSPFDDEDVKRYIWRRYPFWKRRERQKAYDPALKVPLLSVRPMLLAHIPDIVASGVEIKHSYQLYETMVDAWLERESSWAEKATLRQFSEHLAVDLYVKGAERGMERVPRQQLSALAHNWGIPLDTGQTGGRSLLNRDADGNYKFAHRSIMEYLFIVSLKHGNEQCEGVPLTDQMKRFWFEVHFGTYDPPFIQMVMNVLTQYDLGARSITPTNSVVSADRRLPFFTNLFNLTQFGNLRTFSAQELKAHGIEGEFAFLDIDRQAAVKAQRAIQQVTSERRGATQDTEGVVLHLRRTPGKTDGVARLFIFESDRIEFLTAPTSSECYSEIQRRIIKIEQGIAHGLYDSKTHQNVKDSWKLTSGPAWIMDAKIEVFPGRDAVRSLRLARTFSLSGIDDSTAGLIIRTLKLEATTDDSPEYVFRFEPSRV